MRLFYEAARGGLDGDYDSADWSDPTRSGPDACPRLPVTCCTRGLSIC